MRFEKNERKYADELGFFRVLGGRVRVFSVAENGKEITIFYMTNTECCILSTSFMAHIQDEVMFEFMEDCEIFTLKDSDYQALCASNANIMGFNALLMSKRFKQSLDTLGDVAFKSLKERILKFFARKCAKWRGANEPRKYRQQHRKRKRSRSKGA